MNPSSNTLPHLSPQILPALADGGSGGDLIDSLPTSSDKPLATELQIVETLFKQNQSALTAILVELLKPIMVLLLFLIVSSPIADKGVKSVLRNASDFWVLLVKGVVLAAMVWVIENFWLSRK
jgi:hypothetical protein